MHIAQVTNEQYAEHVLLGIYSSIGIDKPSGHDKILAFVVNDVQETADHEFSNDDVRIAFRRLLEKAADELPEE